MKKRLAALTALFYAGMVMAQGGLTGITWTLTTLNGTMVEAAKYTIKFNAGGEASGKVDCNSCGWSWTATGANIAITPGMCTMMACINPSRDFEYTNALASAASYAVSGARLFLMKNADTLAAFVDAAGAARVPLSGVWHLDKLNHSAANIAGYTLTFTSDSTCGSRMQCNSCQYRYDATLQTISFSRAMCTLVACQGASREGECTTAMGKVTAWTVAGDKLYLKAGSDTLLEYSLAVSGIEGKLWLLQSIRRASGRTVIAAPKNYTAKFELAGTVAVKADCNTCSGSYAENAAVGTLVITGLGCTKMMCGVGSMGAIYTSILGGVQKYAVKGDTLFCYAGSDTLVFRTSETNVHKGGCAPAVLRTEFSVALNDRNLVGRGAVAEAGLVDLAGRWVARVSPGVKQQFSIDISKVPAGLYLIRMKSRDGRQVSRLVNLAR